MKEVYVGSSEFVFVRSMYSGFTQWQGRWQMKDLLPISSGIDKHAILRSFSLGVTYVRKEYGASVAYENV